MNNLKSDKQIAVLMALVEGNSIRSVERMTGVHRDTIMRLMLRTGANCQNILYHHLHDLRPLTVQIDEIWSFVFKKDEQLSGEERSRGEFGDQYTYVALDPDTKLVLAHHVGKRDMPTAQEFVHEVRRRIVPGYTPQVTTDGYVPYLRAVPSAFGPSVDFAMLIKSYASLNEGERRYSPPRCSGVSTKIISGEPDLRRVSTSIVERHNLTMRMCLRRLTRLTNGFSKRLDSLRAAMSVYMAHYNFCRVHSSTGQTPAMAAGIAEQPFNLSELLA